jgi:hypothetical protein
MLTPTPHRILPDGRGLWIYLLTFGRARIAVGPLGQETYDDAW